MITLPGKLPESRTTASILSTVGLSSWIAPTPQHYVRLAVDYAREKTVIAKLRLSLRQRMRESPIMDEVGFARDLEDAYRHMWRAWCGGAT